MMTTKKKTKELDEFELNERKFNRYAFYALLGGVLFMFTPLIFTSPYLSQFTSVDFNEKTAAIGSSFNIIIPFLTLTGSLLIYLSFRQQMITNRLQWKAYKKTQEEIQNGKEEKRDEQILIMANILYEKILLRIDTFEFGIDGLTGWNGIDAVYNLLRDHKYTGKNKGITDLNNLLEEIRLYLAYMQRIKSPHFRRLYLEIYAMHISKRFFELKSLRYVMGSVYRPENYSRIWVMTDLLAKKYSKLKITTRDELDKEID